MARTFTFNLATFVVAMCAVPAARAQLPQGWLTDSEEALREGRRTGKPIFAIFHCFH